ncbi:response regulator transcription factor [Oceanirhabdus sp. W0125-5]|uniref:response regulator transcription factor n=1 Tax=Oceanirhabdus sp. W0125-5 TaxID=2999116 RepID=UPI0022F2F6E4|nr:response regulator transcription factor [Oceanirhabdus sp. W0125-5]WBW96935.1 response regulator transcription factor [Oceanirhabdus sp. W0125-5]
MDYKVLVVDDDREIVEVLELYLENAGYEILKAYDGLSALNILRKEEVHLALIDIMMPEINGFNLIKRIRNEKNIPVIFISAKREDSDKILGLSLGADDYITKPFNPMEIIARVNAQLRRAYNLKIEVSEENEKTKIQVGDLTLDTTTCEVWIKDREITLTSVEFKILKLFMENINQVFTKKQIYEKVWNEYYNSDEGTIMTHISNLREKIEDNPKKPTYLKTIRGLGYKIQKVSGEK